MKGWQWNGSEFTSCETVPIEDRGFRYGMSVFETIAIIEGKPQFLPEHLARLAEATIRSGFVHDHAIDIPPIAAFPLTILPRTGVARVYITADRRVLLLVEERARILKPSYVLSPNPVVHLPFPAGLKSGNYWCHLSTVDEARAAGFDEAIFVSPDNILISACMANVFIVRGKALKTPALSSGARDGIVRGWIKTQRPVVETDLRIQDLESADEIFITNSWIGVMPISRFRGEKCAPGAITRTLRQEFEDQLPKN
jgi:branched-subunit amino acid aminotransferase/4-amino-4-deoxychorismate lyase